jgi:hypothetical protein
MAFLHGRVDGQAGQEGTDDALQVDRMCPLRRHRHDQHHYQHLPGRVVARPLQESPSERRQTHEDDRHEDGKLHQLEQEPREAESPREDLHADRQQERGRQVSQEGTTERDDDSLVTGQPEPVHERMTQQRVRGDQEPEKHGADVRAAHERFVSMHRRTAASDGLREDIHPGCRQPCAGRRTRGADHSISSWQHHTSLLHEHGSSFRVFELRQFFIGLEQASQRGQGHHAHDIRRPPRVRITRYQDELRLRLPQRSHGRQRRRLPRHYGVPHGAAGRRCPGCA